MIYAAPSASFEATAQWGTPGLVGTITVAVYDGIGGTSIAPHTTSVVEVASGIYTATLTAPVAAGQYTIVWSDGANTASDELTVTSSTSVPVTPVPGPGMTVGYLLDQILLDRFESEHRPRALLSLNNRYAHLWVLEDWTWRFAQVPCAVFSGVPTLSGLPADFGVPLYLWDENANLLTYLDTAPFKWRYATSDQGIPEAWSVIAGQVSLGPTPSYTSSLYSIYYRRKLIPFTDETQTPLIPQEFHLALVHGARAELLAFYNDPVAMEMEQQWQLDLEALRREYLADATGQPSMWPSDGLHASSTY